MLKNLGVDGVTLAYVTNEGKAKENYNDLSVSEAEKFDIIDHIISDYKKKNTNMTLYIDARQLLGEYIYKKHGLKIEATSTGCKGGDSRFYIIADGTILPCSPSGTTMGKYVNEKYLEGLTPPNILKDNMKDIIDSDYFIKFYNYAHNISQYKILTPCKSCKYQCYPCPLLYNEKNPNIKECIYAKSKIEDIENKMLKIYPYKNNKIRKNIFENRIEILDFDTQDKYILEDIGLDIWNLIDQKNNIMEIIRVIQKEYNTEKDEEVNEMIHRDVLDFIFSLKEKNFIYY